MRARCLAPDEMLIPKEPLAAAIAFMASPYDALCWELEDGEDDLDHFKFRWYVVDDCILAQVIRYDGNPPDTYTILVVRTAKDVVGAEKAVLSQCLDMPESVIDWTRP